MSTKPPQCPWDITVSVIECIFSLGTSLYRFKDENLNNSPDIKPLVKLMGWGIAEHALEGLLSKCL